MALRLILISSVVVGAVFQLACSAGPPKQIAPPMIEDTGQEDMVAEEDKTLEPVGKPAEEMSAEEKHTNCCQQCSKGMSEDKTGDTPDKIPCADFTAVLEDYCLDYFRSKPMMASECEKK